MAEEPTPEAPKGEDDARRRAREMERLESLRERLYARGGPQESGLVRHDIHATAHSTPLATAPATSPEPVITAAEPLVAESVTPMSQKSSRKTFRFTLALFGVLFFIGALVLASVFLFTGKNTISGNNIAIDVSGPIEVGGGDTMNLQISIANQNTLPIESATLIITYPRGAQSAAEPGKELFTERQQLNNINPNEVVNVPVRLLMFGEENDSKKVLVSVEYRVKGSNATFVKDALPFEFKIGSSPIVINVDTVKRIPSGQEITLEIGVVSNAPEELKDLLVRASYPQGFDFTTAVPETVSGQDIWKIASLKPGEQKKFTIKGVVNGKENDVHSFSFTVGVANAQDALSIASTLATRNTEMTIERPFLDVQVTVNGSKDDPAIIDPSSAARVTVVFANALDATVYDGVISAVLGGNALNEIMVRADDGNYDSSKNTIAWDSIDVPELRELAPGEKHSVSFTVEPRSDIRENPEIKLSVSIHGNRMSENTVPEQVVGTIERTIKVASITKIASSALYSEGPFTNSGPTPPVAEKTTEYAFLFTVRNGTNPVTGAEVTAAMPAYVTWLDRTSEDSGITYNATNRTIKWNVGDLKANAYKEVWMQVAFKPSLSQVGLTPTLLESQRFRATDRFTGTSVRAESPALTTNLANDPDDRVRDGRVREN